MKTLYLQCNMGAAGDMLVGALLELHPDPASVLEKINSLGLPGVHIGAEPSIKCGIRGIHVRVHVHDTEEGAHSYHKQEQDQNQEHHHKHSHTPHHPHDHSHTHASYQEIRALLRTLPLSDQVKEHALSVYLEIGEAESAVHGTPLEQIHFHEVGTLDAVTDVIACCLLIEELAPDKIIVSPIHVGNGTVLCAHGELPVPAPATALLLRGIPFYSGTIQSELCTPTGAALLRHFADSFGPMPPLCVRAIGYGMGSKDFETANCVRAFWGTTQEEGNHQILELRCNLDDMTPEALAYACELLLKEGALDVFTSPAGMKKGRHAVLLTCLCPPDLKDHLVHLILSHTTTLGVRSSICERNILSSIQIPVNTPYGVIRIKSSHGYGIEKVKPEYDDIVSAAEKYHVSFSTVSQAALYAWKQTDETP